MGRESRSGIPPMKNTPSDPKTYKRMGGVQVDPCGCPDKSKILTDISLDDLSAKEFRWYWVDFDSPFDEEAALLRTYFRFDDLSIDDCLERLERPKVDFYDTYNFLFFMLWRKRRWNPLNWTYLSAGITLLPFINNRLRRSRLPAGGSWICSSCPT